MDISASDIKLILATLETSEFAQAEVVIGDVRIAVARPGEQLPSASAAPSAPAAAPAPAAPASPASVAAAPAPAAAPAAEPTPAPATTSVAAADETGAAEGHVVESPSVGVFWRAPSPGSDPFVEVGQEVSVGETIGIVEVMKLMTNVAADTAGVVTAVHTENAASVQLGTPLISISPKA